LIRPNISVVIPTRNRQEYLQHAIRTVLDQWEEGVELIVSDNHSTDGTWEYLKSLNDVRVKICRPDVALSMTKHFEYILSQPSGEWITLFGDDDGLQPYFFKAAKKLIQKWGEDYSVIHGPRAYFFWPGVEEVYGESVVDFRASSECQSAASNESLKQLAYGREKYFDYPQFYTGTIFSRKLLDDIRLRHKDGNIFHSIVPDANSTAVILLNTKKCLKIGLPLAWVGSSPKSTGFQAAGVSMSKNNLKSSILTDFISLTNSSEIRAANEFANIIRLMSNKACYLESLYQTSNANDYRTKKFFCKRWPKHRMFFSIYEEYLEKKRNGGEICEYEKLFRDNKLSLTLFRLLVVVDPLLSFPFWFHTKIRKRIHRIHSGKKKQVIFTCFKRGVHENILSANRELQSEPLNSKISQIIRQLGEK
jgi:glycosyltransferase involved in cell wall biosynthesis